MKDRLSLNAADPTTAAPLAIIGIGCLFPEGGRPRRATGPTSRTASTPSPTCRRRHWRPDDYFDADPKAPDRIYAARGGFLDPVAFNPADFGIAPNNLEATDTSQLLGLVVAQQALDDAGYARRWPGDRSTAAASASSSASPARWNWSSRSAPGSAIRSGGGPCRRPASPSDVADDVVQRIGESYVGWQENSFPGLLGNVVAGRIANRFDLGGTNCVVDAACASSLGAVHLAALELADRPGRHGR